jgi:hypothetical protein
MRLWCRVTLKILLTKIRMKGNYPCLLAQIVADESTKHNLMKYIHLMVDRYQNANGSFEIRIPTAAVESVIGADGANISEIRKVPC